MRLSALFPLLLAPLFAAEPTVIPLLPGAEKPAYEESVIEAPNGGGPRVLNVSRPVLLAFPAEKPNGTAVIICPGGGFRRLSIEMEGADVARWLNTLGVSAFVLKYRVMRTGDEGEKDAAVMAQRRKEAIPLAVADGKQAVRLVRERAAEWGIKPDRIGIMGFSAGGYVTAAVALESDPATRPNFAAPIYGAMPPDVKPPAGAPPLFLLHAGDDPTVPVLTSTIRLYAAWREAGIPAELHIYPAGGHGFGFRKLGKPINTWPDRFREWLDALYPRP